MIPVLSMCRAPRRLVLVCACLGGALTGPVIHAQTPARPGGSALRIGLVLDGPHGRMTDVRPRLSGEIASLLGGPEAVRLDAADEIVADWTVTGIRSALARAVADPSLDLVIAFGVVGSQLAAELGPLAKPVIAALVPEPRAAGFPSDSALAAAGLHPVAPQFSRLPLVAFREMFGVQRVAVLVPAALAEVAPALGPRLAEIAGLEGGWTVGASPDPVETVARIPADADGVYLLPVLEWTEADTRAFAEGLAARRLPSFSWNGGDEVRDGIAAAASAEPVLGRLPRWVAVTVEAVTRTRQAGTAPTTFLVREQTTLNRHTIQAIGASPRWRDLVDAQFVDSATVEAGAQLTLTDAIVSAIQLNVDLSASSRAVEAGAAQVRLAGAPLLPQLGIAASARWLGGNILASAEPYAASGAFTGRAGFSQVLYDDRAWANYSIEKSLQSSREYGFAAQQLDIARAAAATYIAVLGQRTLARIQRANADLTRSNLEIARIREATGGGRLAEVYRWQTQLAQAQDALVQATTAVGVAEQELNRLLHRALTQPVVLGDLAVDDPAALSQTARIGTYLDTPEAFETFRRFVAAEAMEASPDLLALDAQIEAYARQVSAAGRAFWLPSFSLEAGGLYRFTEWGDTQAGGGNGLWTVALVGRYPIFAGTARLAESDRASRERERVTLQREATRERVEQAVGVAALQVRGAFVGLEVAREAADAARRNYALVEESYREGVGAIIMLLDAQGAALTADLRAATAAYEVLVSLADLQRAVGRFDLFGSAEARDEFFQRLDTFFTAAGVEVRR